MAMVAITVLALVALGLAWYRETRPERSAPSTNVAADEADPGVPGVGTWEESKDGRPVELWIGDTNVLAAPPPPPPPVREPLLSERRVAIHEAGHVIAAWHCTAVIEVVSATIEPSTHSGGSVVSQASRGTKHHTWCHLVRDLAGLSAEALVFGNFRTGPSENDLEWARYRARDLVGTSPPWKDVEETTPDFFTTTWDPPLPPEETLVFAQAYRQARRLVRAYKPSILRVADMLQEKRTVEDKDLKVVLGSRVLMLALSILGPAFVMPARPMRSAAHTEPS